MYRFLKANKKAAVVSPLFIYWFILFLLTSIPLVQKITSFGYEDKVEHFLAYAVLGVLLALALHFQQKYPRLQKRYLSATYVIILLYGLFDELHQLVIPGRYAEFFDYLANLLGGLLGIGIAYLFIRQNIDPEL